MLKIRNLVLYFFKLKLWVSFNFALSYINKCSEVLKILLKKSIYLSSKQQFYLTLILILMQEGIDLSIKKRDNK